MGDLESSGSGSPLLEAGQSPNIPGGFYLDDPPLAKRQSSINAKAPSKTLKQESGNKRKPSTSSVSIRLPTGSISHQHEHVVLASGLNSPNGPIGCSRPQQINRNQFRGASQLLIEGMDSVVLESDLASYKEHQSLSSHTSTSSHFVTNSYPVTSPINQGRKTAGRYQGNGSSSNSSDELPPLLVSRGSSTPSGASSPARKPLDLGLVQYIEERDLEPIYPPPTTSILNSVYNRLASENWKLQFEGLTDLRRLAKFHSPLLTQSISISKASKRVNSPFLHQICYPLLTDLIDSLRSNVAKNAMLGLHDLFFYLGHEMSDSTILDRMLTICLRKAGAPGAGSFLIVEAERSLRQLCLSVTAEARLVNYLLKNLTVARTNQKLRSIIAQCLCVLILRLNWTLPQVLSTKDITSLANSVVKLTSEASLHTRRYAKLAVCSIYKYLSDLDPSKLRQIFVESELKELTVTARLASKTLDADVLLGIPWESFVKDNDVSFQFGSPPHGGTSVEPTRTPSCLRSTTPPRSGSTRVQRLPSTVNPSRSASSISVLVSPRPSSPSYQSNLRFAFKSIDEDSVLNTPRASVASSKSNSDRRPWTPTPSRNRADPTGGARNLSANQPRNHSPLPDSTELKDGKIGIRWKSDRVQKSDKQCDLSPTSRTPSRPASQSTMPSTRPSPIIISHQSGSSSELDQKYNTVVRLKGRRVLVLDSTNRAV